MAVAEGSGPCIWTTQARLCRRHQSQINTPDNFIHPPPPKSISFSLFALCTLKRRLKRAKCRYGTSSLQHWGMTSLLIHNRAISLQVSEEALQAPEARTTKTRRYDWPIALFLRKFKLTYLDRRRSPSMNHLHSLRHESAVGSASKQVPMPPRSSHPSILPPDAS